MYPLLYAAWTLYDLSSEVFLVRTPQTKAYVKFMDLTLCYISYGVRFVLELSARYSELIGISFISIRLSERS